MNNRNVTAAPLLRPVAELDLSKFAAAVIPLLAVSGLLVIIAAYAMPDGYSWRIHSISESAAQAQRGAWIARLSFLSFGAAVLFLCLAMRSRWSRVTYWSNLVFAVSMFGAAAFSHSPWLTDSPIDRVEDILHSFFATGMGFAFCLGVIARFVQRGTQACLGRSLDVLALAVATALPLLLAMSATYGGLAQRVMFAVAYIWFSHEALIALNLVRENNR